MNEKNLCIIGQGNSGKTTLVGYLSSLEQFKDIREFKDKLVEIKSKCEKRNIPFKKELSYTYFVDELKETIRNRGNTQTMHVIGLYNYGLSIIDIPGIEHDKKGKKILASINNCDFCFFTMDVRDAENIFIKEQKNKKLLDAFFTAYNLFKENLVLLLTKCDTLENEPLELKDIYISIKMLLKTKRINIDIIPIGIKVVEFKVDSNIKTKKYEWYKGLTILEFFEKKAGQINENEEANDFSLGNYLYKYTITNKKSNKLKIWRFIIKNGKFQVDEIVNMGPIRQNDQIGFAKVEIKEIRDEFKNNIEICSKNSIVTMNLSKMKFENKNIKKKDLEIDTSKLYPYIYSNDVEIKFGNLLEIEFEDSVIADDKESYVMVWYNKKIMCKYSKKNGIDMLKLDEAIYLPCFNETVLNNMFTIRKSNWDNDSLINLYNIKIKITKIMMVN